MSNLEIDARAFLASLDKYQEDVLEGLQKDIEKAALTLEKNAKQNCPVDTGKLRASITTEVGNLEAEVGTNVEYAPYVELGARGRDGKHMLQRAATEHTDEYKRLMEDSMKNA